MSKKNLFFYNLNEKLKEFPLLDYYCDSKFIDKNECNKLLNKFFSKNNKNNDQKNNGKANKKISYHQINIYIKVLADQLRKFSINFYLMIENLKSENLSGNIRTDIIQAFMDLTNYFTIGAFEDILSESDSSDSSNKSNTTEFDENNAIINSLYKLSEKESVFNFNQLIDKALVFINEDGQSFTIITCAPKTSDIYKKLDSLFNSGAKFGEDKGKHLNIPDFTEMVKNEDF